MDKKFSIRSATANDVPVILNFIRALAVYEKLAHEVVATEELLRHTLFEKKSAEVLLASEGGADVGFAVFFHNFSTFLGRPGIYLEDVFVLPEFRGRGYGKALLIHIARLAVERDCGRFEWSVLDWNQPAIDFYRSIGAKPLSEWTIQRMTGESIKSFAAQKIPGEI
jgi:GNAT superfamily N-acetyltransferase